MRNMSCILCQDVCVLLPLSPPPHFMNYSRAELGQVGAKQPDRRRDRGSIVVQLSIVMVPVSVGFTRGYMPYQDPVYSQPKKLPATHFHNAACGPLQKLISLCRRCTIMLPAPYFHFAFCLFCFNLLFLYFIFPTFFFFFLLDYFLFFYSLQTCLFISFLQLSFMLFLVNVSDISSRSVFSIFVCLGVGQLVISIVACICLI